METAIRFISSGMFYKESSKIIFEAMESLHYNRKPVDMMTVMEKLSNDHRLTDIGGPYALTQLTQGVVSSSSIEEYAKIIFQKHHLRELLKLSFLIQRNVFEAGADNFEVHKIAEEFLTKVGITVSGEMIHISNVIPKAIELTEKWKAEAKDGVVGIPSGIQKLDKTTRGWQNGDLIIIAARPSVGKTAFALQCAIAAAGAGHSVAIWSMEMKSEYLVLRVLSSASKVDMHKIQAGAMNDDQTKDFYTAASDMLNLPLYFSDSPGESIDMILNKARRLKRQGKLGMIMIDYMQLVKSAKSYSREREVAEISGKLKDLSLELDIPVIALSQLSRSEGEKNVTWKFGPGLSSLRESGSIEQDADVVLMQWRADDQEVGAEPSLFNKRKVRVAKQRNGMLNTIDLVFDGATQSFREDDNNPF